MNPIKSPVQMKTGSPLFLVKLAADLLKVHNKLMEQIPVFTESAKKLADERARIIKLPPGEKGAKGDRGIQGVPGYSPRKNVDYFDGKDGKDGVDGKNPDLLKVAELAATMITQPKDGETPAMDAIVEAVLKELKLDEKLKGFSNELASTRNQLAGKIYGKDTWARGGGDTVSAGSNITLVHKADGTVEINASGGGSGTNVTTQYALAAVQSGSDITVDLSQLTNFATFTDLIQVIKNNLPQTEGASFDFTVAGNVITIFNSSDGDIVNVTYAYS